MGEIRKRFPGQRAQHVEAAHEPVDANLSTLRSPELVLQRVVVLEVYCMYSQTDGSVKRVNFLFLGLRCVRPTKEGC